MSLLNKAFGSGMDDIDWHWNHHYGPQKPVWDWTTQALTYTPILYPLKTTDKETGEVTESISFDVPGLTAKDIKVQWFKDIRTLTLVGINEKFDRTYTFSFNTFSEDLLEDTLTTTVENGVATITGRLKDKKKKDESTRVVDVPVK